MTKISVIMPIYNAENFLKRSINSISEQTLDEIELICVNDGSTDNSLQILDNLKKEYDFIKVIYQANFGPSIARNNAIDFAEGEYIAFLDADDIYIDNTALEKMYNTGKSNDADMVGANLIRVANSNEYEGNFNYFSDNYKYFYEKTVITPKEYGVPLAFYKNIYKSSFLKENNIKFPNLRIGEDPVFLAEILTKIDKIYTVPCDLYGYYYDSEVQTIDKINNTSIKIEYLTHYKKIFEILEKNNFDTLLEKYKKIFIDILKIKERKKDKEYINLVFRIFNNIELYYHQNIQFYVYLKIIRNKYIKCLNP